jgi:hypothetical protein
MNKFTRKNRERGQAMILVVILFVSISLAILLGVVGPVIRQKAIVSDLVRSRTSYFLAEAGIEDVLHRLMTGKSVENTEVISLNGQSATVTTVNTSGGKQVSSSANVNQNYRKVSTNISFGTGVSFHYGVQAGQGGFILRNTSSITGNVFSGGSVVGSGNTVRGDVVSSGPTGLIDGINATGTAFSNTIKNSTIGKDAYYKTLTNTTVTGVKYPNSPDQGTVDLPISDAQINQWESDAAAGGTMLSTDCDSFSSNTCTITSSRTIGPIKIPFNLVVKSSSAIITVSGPLWVVGNIDFQTGPTIRMSSSLSNQNVAIIADNPANRTTSGIITVGQSTAFQGSGSPGSFVFLISQNTSGENGGSIDAISMNQGASALVAYASHGQITLSQSVSVKEVTAYKIILSQSANVTYDRGLPSVLFSAGPSGGYNIDTWKETQ